MSNITPSIALNRAIDKAGGISALSKALNLSGHGVIHQWRLKRVPAEQCPRIEELTGVRCEEIRPDVRWDVLRQAANANIEGAPKAPPALAVTAQAAINNVACQGA